MSIERMIELLRIEHKCMLAKSHGDCDSNCEMCALCQDDCELHEMYTSVLKLLEEQEVGKLSPDGKGKCDG